LDVPNRLGAQLVSQLFFTLFGPAVAIVDNRDEQVQDDDQVRE